MSSKSLENFLLENFQTTKGSLEVVLRGTKTYLSTMCLIEPLKQFLLFIEKISQLEEITAKHILQVDSLDCWSTTGNNLQNILVLTNKSWIEQLTPRDANQIRYHPINTDNEWKINCILEIIETLNSKMDIQCFEECELKDMLDFLCTC